LMPGVVHWPEWAGRPSVRVLVVEDDRLLAETVFTGAVLRRHRAGKVKALCGSSISMVRVTT
jgi:hypothetical protein